MSGKHFFFKRCHSALTTDCKMEPQDSDRKHVVATHTLFICACYGPFFCFFLCFLFALTQFSYKRFFVSLQHQHNKTHDAQNRHTAYYIEGLQFCVQFRVAVKGRRPVYWPQAP